MKYRLSAFAAAFFTLIAAACAVESVKDADQYYEIGRYDRAAEEYRDFIKENPNMASVPNAYLGLAWSEYRLERYPEAEGAVAILLTRYPGHYLEPQARYLRAMTLFAQNKFVECSEELEDLILKFPADPLIPDARVLLGRSSAAQLRYVEAAEQYKIYLERYGDGPYVPAALIGRAEALAKSTRWQEAAETLEAFCTRFRGHPERPRAMLELARSKMAFGDYDGAEPYLDEIIHGYSDTGLALRAQSLLVDLYDATRRRDMAASAAHNLLTMLDSRETEATPQLLFRLAQYNAENGETALARAYFKRIASEFESDSSRHAYALAWLTIDEMSRGNREEALAFGTRLLSLYPAHPQADGIERIIIDVYSAAGRHADAAAIFETLLKKRWANAAPIEFYRLASLYMDLKDYPSAERSVNEGLARAERAAETSSVLSGLYHSMILHDLSGNTAKAIESWWRLKRISPNYVTVTEKVYWDDREERFYEENRVPPERRGEAVFAVKKQKIHLGGFEWKYGDARAMELSNSMTMTFASATEASGDMTYVSQNATRFVDEIVKAPGFEKIPDSWFPLRASIGADWIVHGRISRMTGGDGEMLRLDLRLVRVDYDKLFPFEYKYEISLSEEPAAASRIVRESIERMRLYRPER